MADTQIFMKIAGITGEADASGFKNGGKWIEVESVSWDMEIAHELLDSNQSNANKLQMKEVKISKIFDFSTCPLLTRMKEQNAEQKKFAFPAVNISFVDVLPNPSGGTDAVKVMGLELQDCYLKQVSIQASGSGKSVQLSEELTISFLKIKVQYHRPNENTRAVRSRVMTFEAPTS